MTTDFKKVLSKKREAVPTPENVVDESGKCYFGTFDKEFQKMDFLKVNRPSALPNVFNRFRLTQWEACEVNFDKIIMLTAVCDMGSIATALTIIYDKSKRKCAYWKAMLPSSKIVIGATLLNGAKTYSKSGKVKIKFINDFQKGEALAEGFSSDKKSGSVEYSIKLSRVSKPSIVNIPFRENMPLYSQKDLFSVEGYIKFNGERFTADGASTAIIDDHRGYYPRKSHYDWVTTLGKKEIDGKEQYFGFNLTRNQSINQDDYNENLIWLENDTTLLTPVVFQHKNDKLWHIKDEYGMTDVSFEIYDEFLMFLPLKLIDINYHITFGKLKGFVCSPDGKKYILDGMDGIGEDKSLVF